MDDAVEFNSLVDQAVDFPMIDDGCVKHAKFSLEN